MKRLFQIGLIIFALVVSFFLLKPFLSALAFAAALAYLTYPAYTFLNRRLPHKLSASILTGGLICLTVAFIAWGINLLLVEFSSSYASFSSLSLEVVKQLPFGQTISSIIDNFVSNLVSSLSGFISTIPQIILSLFVFFATYFYLLLDGKRVWGWLKANIPLDKEQKNEIFGNVEVYAHTLINVWILIAIAQGIAAEVIFIVLDLPYPMLAGIIAATLSILPIVGTGLLYFPVSAYLIFTGDITTGIILLAYAIPVGGTLDYILRPYFTSKWAEIHPLIVLVGIFGGMLIFGAAGLVIGPILLLISLAVFKGIGKKKINETQNKDI